MRQANKSAFARAWPAVIARFVQLSGHHWHIRDTSTEIISARWPGAGSAAREQRADHASWVDDRSFCLYVPTEAASAEGRPDAWNDRLRKLGLASIVPIVGETRRDSMDVLNVGCDAGVVEAEPYLEVVVGGETGAFLYYRGDEIERELSALHETLGRR
jgi:hypothetical protein